MGTYRVRLALKIVLAIALIALLMLFSHDELDFIYQNF